MIKIKTYLKTDKPDSKINFKKVAKKISKALKKFFKSNNVVSVIVIDDNQIKELNKRYRLKDYVTDVLSFESGEDKYLGDIFICLNKVYEQASAYKHSLEREYAFLLVHGLLHLLGFDHEKEEEEKKMFELQERILDYAKYKREL